jgi:hypothetical protein
VVHAGFPSISLGTPYLKASRGRDHRRTATELPAPGFQATRFARLLQRVPVRLDCRATLRRVVVLDERRRVRDGK